MFLSAILTGLVPIAFARIVDSLSSNDDLSIPLAAFWLLAAYATTHWLSRTLAELGPLLFGGVEQRVNRVLSLRMFSHLLALPLQFHLDRKIGSIGQVLVAGLNGLRLILQHACYTVVPVVVEVITVTFVLWSLASPFFLVLFLITALLYLAVFVRSSHSLSRPAAAITGTSVDAHGILNDVLMNFEAVKTFGADATVRERYDQALALNQASWSQLFQYRFRMGLAVAAIFAFSLAVSLLHAMDLVAAHEMSIGTFVLVSAYMLRIATPAQMLGVAVRDTTEAVAHLQAMLKVLGESPEPSVEAPSGPLEPGPGCLTFDDVSFAYGTGRTILEHVSFSIPAGKTLALVGPTGSGKSSLARLLLRLCDPHSGEIRLDGTAIASLSPQSVRDLISVVPQDTVLFNASIAYNIALGKLDATVAEIERAAEIAGLGSLIADLPEGYDTAVGERGLKLSGGERQRIAIARAVIRRPRVFVFDEATSSLDPRTERAIMERISNVAKDTTTLMIAHRLTTIADADEILVLDHGRIVERGTHEQLRKMQGRYASLWSAQRGADLSCPVN